MEYKYEGKDEFEGYVLECNVPLEKWEFGTIVDINLYQPERLSEKTLSNEGSDSLNSMET